VIEPSVEARLVAELQGGNRRARDRAISELHALLARPLHQLCLRVACHPTDAEDALQETFVDVMRGIGSFRGGARLTSWVYRVAIRAALRVRSRRERSASREGPSFDGLELDERAARDSGRAPSDPARLAAEREGAARLLAAIGRLPAAQRAVLGLAALEELPQTEVAEILGVPVGTVHSRLSAARAKLREELERGGSAKD